ncbi:Uncharacterised protein [uncultured Blautia sp.]|nr:Uncharacterised protein [uncultured Blautia sp.]
MPPGGLCVPGVGEVIELLPGDQGHAVGSGGVEAGGVKTVGLMGQQHTVQVTGFQLSGDFSKMIHRVTSWASIFSTEALINP